MAGKHPDDLTTAEMAEKHGIPLATMRGLVRRWRAMGETNRKRETQQVRDYADRIPNTLFTVCQLPGFAIPSPQPGDQPASSFFRGLLITHGLPENLTESQARAVLIAASVRMQKLLCNWRQAKILALHGVNPATVSFEVACFQTRALVKAAGRN